jgi:hypothetical protein
MAKKKKSGVKARRAATARRPYEYDHHYGLRLQKRQRQSTRRKRAKKR